MPPVGFEPAITASERLQTNTLSGTATGTVPEYWIKPSMNLTKEGFFRNYCSPFFPPTLHTKIIDFSNHCDNSPLVSEN
jgi:hypothetical protein